MKLKLLRLLSYSRQSYSRKFGLKKGKINRKFLDSAPLQNRSNYYLNRINTQSIILVLYLGLGLNTRSKY